MEKPRRRGRGLRRILLVALAIVIVLAIALPFVWIEIASTTRAMARDFLSREAALGRRWSCAGPADLEGFPFALSFDCKGAKFEGVFGGRSVKASAKAVHIRDLLLWPFHPKATIDGPLTVEREGSETVLMSWRSLDLTLDAVPFRIDHVDALVEGLSASLWMDAQTIGLVDANRLAVRARPLLAGADNPAAEVAATLAGAVSPLLNESIPSNDRADIDALVRFDHVDSLMRGSLADRLEAWRLAGGRLTIEAVHGVRGDSSVEARGGLDLDDAHRLAGTIDASLAGIEPVLQRFGIPTGVAKLGSMLSSFMGGSPKAIAAAKPGAISLQVRLEDGRIYAGPIRLHPALVPLY